MRSWYNYRINCGGAAKVEMAGGEGGTVVCGSKGLPVRDILSRTALICKGSRCWGCSRREFLWGRRATGLSAGANKRGKNSSIYPPTGTRGGGWGVGFPGGKVVRCWVSGVIQCPMPNAQCPIPHAQCPMPHAQCPMPHAPCPIPQCPMPNAPCPMPQCPMPHAPFT
jgi:hypothetical protein